MGTSLRDLIPGVEEIERNIQVATASEGDGGYGISPDYSYSIATNAGKIPTLPQGIQDIISDPNLSGEDLATIMGLSYESDDLWQTAKELGIETSIDLVSENSDRYNLVRPCLPYTDYLIINELEAGKLTGIEPCVDNLEKMALQLKGMGVRKKVIIHMPECAVCAGNKGVTLLPSYQLPEGYIQGTTGAGDAFCAGALTGIYHGWSDEEILSFASASAVMALGSPDATSGLRTMEETRAYCSQFLRRLL